MAIPPVPLAWKATTSYPISSKDFLTLSAAWVMKPNMLRAIRFLSSFGVQSLWAMPQIAPAALSRIFPRILFTPRISTTLCIMVMSFVPTMLVISREATVETITLGTPTGRTCIMLVPRCVPVPPPAEIIPPISSFWWSSKTSSRALRSTASTAWSLLLLSLVPFLITSACRSWSGRKGEGPFVPTLMVRVRKPLRSIHSLRKKCSSPLESKVPTMAIAADRFMAPPSWVIDYWLMNIEDWKANFQRQIILRYEDW